MQKPVPIPSRAHCILRHKQPIAEKRNCTYLTDVKSRRSLYLSFVRALLSYGSELWAPQTTSKVLLTIEGVQRRDTKYS